MRITHKGRTYELEPKDLCWKLTEIRVGDDPDKKNFGKEYHTSPVWPGTFQYALKCLLEMMVRDTLSADASLEEAVATVAHLYATIGDSVRVEGALIKAAWEKQRKVS